MSAVRYISRRLAEAAFYGLAAGLIAAAFTIGLERLIGFPGGIAVTQIVALQFAGSTALAVVIMRAMRSGWEDQSSLNYHMGVGQYERDKEVAHCLDQQWFKWWL
ncbi:MAG: hypothetical protein EBR79_02505 [Proteobacteria bacterium]|nr:hypothetical protein [Pseudomonadota bacterium]NBX86161.1 hypothetical protein [Pseudomonadota bacterium]